MPHPPPPIDLRALRRRDPQAVTAFVAAVEGPTYAVARAFFGADSIVDDVVQSTLLRALTRLDQFDASRGPLRTWVAAIARNLCRDRLRRTQRESVLTMPSPEGPPPTLPSSLRDDLDNALTTLSTDQRLAFLLMQVYDLPATEVALITAAPPATVRSRCARARAALRRALAAHAEVSP